jgi:site-specific recombinase XerD
MAQSRVRGRPTVQRLRDNPLTPYIEPYTEQLRAEGYARNTVETQRRAVADFGRWLATHRIAAQAITAEHIQAFLRNRPGCLRRGDGAGLSRLWTLLRRRGVTPTPPGPRAIPADQVCEAFRRYLLQERGLAPVTVAYYVAFVREFLLARFEAGPIRLAALVARDITGFVQQWAVTLRSRRVQLLTTALRAFLRFARYQGALTTDLAACVPAVANWADSTIPRALPRAAVEAVLAACIRQTAVGRRDYAILLLLARLGLRAGEIVALTLEDLDWRTGWITVHGKGGGQASLPLPVECGAALAAYLQHGRPRATSRHVFLRARAPFRSFQGPAAVGSVVKRALARAGVETPRKGAHQFRHGLACDLLRHGASLAEIGELLRHRSPETTAIYAKVDLVALRPLALRWPGGGR